MCGPFPVFQMVGCCGRPPMIRTKVMTIQFFILIASVDSFYEVQKTILSEGTRLSLMLDQVRFCGIRERVGYENDEFILG